MAAALSVNQDLTESIHSRMMIDHSAFRGNPRNARRHHGSVPVTIENLRAESRNERLLALKQVMSELPTCQEHITIATRFNSAQDYRSFWYKTASGVALVQMLRDNAITGGYRLLSDILTHANNAYASRNGLGSENVRTLIQNPLGAYVDMRDELFERVAKTGDFSNLIQKQERLLIRIAVSLQQGIKRTLAQTNSRALPYVVLLNEHMQDDKCQGVPESQRTAFMLDLLIDTYSWEAYSMDIMGGLHIQEIELSKNLLKKFITSTNAGGKISDHVQPDD